LSESKPSPVSVLVVEDETLIRMMIVDMVEELGHTVAAEAANIQEASSLAQTVDFQIAILDINVGRERIDAVADIIADRGLPFVFASGYGAVGPPERYRHISVLQKSFLAERLGEAIQQNLRKSDVTS
jgi:CheY-like chemotaxis protein